MKKKILIVGAGFLQDFVIRKAKSMGYTVLAVDADLNAVGFSSADAHEVISIVDEKACLEYAKRENIDGVLTAATDYGVLTAAYIAREMGLCGLDYEAAKTVKNKYKVRKCLFENKVDDTEQAYEVNADTDIAKISEKLIYPVMVKPCDGSGSRGACRVDSADMLEKACRIAMENSITRRAEIETFIFGREYGAESLVIGGEVHVLGIMKKHMTDPPYYAELGHAMPSCLPEKMEKRARECVKKAIESLGINFGSVNMDMLITENGSVHIVDIGARMGGNMIGPCVIPCGTGIDYMANMIRAAVGDPVELNAAEHSAVATRLLAFEGGTVKRLPDIEAMEREYGVRIYHHLKVGDTVNLYRTNLDGKGYIIAEAETVSDAEEKAEAVKRAIAEYIF